MSKLAPIDENNKTTEVRHRKNAKNIKIAEKSKNKSVKETLKNRKQDNEAKLAKKRAIVILVKLTLLIGGIGYWFLTKNSKTNNIKSSSSPTSPSSNSNTIAYQTENYSTPKFQELSCSSEYHTSNQKGSDDCTPTKCGRLVLDDILTDEELDVLTSIAKEGTMIAGGGAGGASIIELHTSSASAGENFISLFNRAQQGHEETIDKMEVIYSDYNMQKYKEIKEKLMGVVAETWGIKKEKLNLAAPTFFSRLTNKEAVTQNDEYWHKHVDTLQYRVFHYTGLIYLSDYSTDFQGGRFIFDTVDKKSSKFKADGHPTEQIIEPKKGRFSVFTSGHENPHHVERVSSGIRYAFTMGFTCNSEYKIKDPELPRNKIRAKVPDFEYDEEDEVVKKEEKISLDI